MNTKGLIVSLIALVVLAIVAMSIFGAISGTPETPATVPDGAVPGGPGTDDEQVFCTMDAMMCPDGSFVGRVGPNCEFAACPAGNATTSTTVPPTDDSSDATSVTAGLNQSVTAGGLTVTPLAVLEDSRCPTDVTCIQAGTVRLSVQLSDSSGTRTVELELGTLVTSGSREITLTEVGPSQQSTVTISQDRYRFTFGVE